MLSLFKLILVALTSVVLIGLVKAYKPDLAVGITICASVLLLYLILDELLYSINYINQVFETISSGKTYYKIIIKVLIIAYLTEFSIALCTDAGEKAIASKLELAGKIAIFVTAVPIFNSIFNLLEELI